MPLPTSSSITVQGHLVGGAVGTKPKRAIFLRLPNEIIDALITRRANKPNDPPLDIDFGEHPGIHIGSNFFPTEFAELDRRNKTHEIFSLMSNKAHAPLRHFAAVEGNVLVKRELDEKMSDRVKSSTTELERRAKERTIQVLDIPQTRHLEKGKSVRKTKPATKLPVNKAPAPSILPKKLPSKARATSPLPPPVTKATSAATEHMRFRLIHFLAVNPSPSADIHREIGGTSADATTKSNIATLLSQVAIEDMQHKRSDPNPPPRCWRLKAESWLEVRPYEYPNLTDEERKRLALQTKQSLRHLNIPQSDPRWEHVINKTSTASTSASTSTQSTPRNAVIGSAKSAKLLAESGSGSKPSPPPAASSRRSLPGSQNASRSAKMTKVQPASPPPNPVKDAVKEVPLVNGKTKTTKEPPQRGPSKQIVDRTKRKRDEDIEEELIKTSETKRRKPSTELTNESPPRLSPKKSGNGNRVPSNSLVEKAVNRSVTPTSLAKTQKSNGSSSSRRRRSPIYTSSSSDEEVEEVRRTSKMRTPSFSEKREASPKVRNGRHRGGLPYSLPKVNFGGPLPKDHASLRKRYNALYPSYIAVYQKCVEQRMTIEKLLEDTPPAEEGEVEEEVTVTSDVEMMDAGDLERLNADFVKLENELSRINEAIRSAVS